MNEFEIEYYKFCGKKFNKYSIICLFKILCSHTLKYIYFSRKYQNSNNFILKKIFLILSKNIGIKYGLEIPRFDRVGKGLLLCHAYNITVNEKAIIGEHVTLFKGCTIGSVRSGNRKGAPIIGNRVVIGLNATICGNVKIGNDVFIAPNAFVNFDVPDNSIVIGNPGVIHKKEKAAIDYFYSFKRVSEDEYDENL